jgi:hypothetical protein
MKDRSAENTHFWNSIIEQIGKNRFSLDGAITAQFHVKRFRHGFLFSIVY